ncbi:c-type cytochrome [Achromobacter ruhlandii]|uniref:c-type cytochrome n=1 Tax=Achromobacter ruhlandii TaxID=72557 RepID=UPI001E56D0B8|nr:c-type cytochrome [Achromobacter ruhlandii]
MVSNAALALAALAAPAGMLTCLAAARRRGQEITAGLPLPWLAALTLAAVGGVLALAWQRAQGVPGLLGSRLGHLALAVAALLLLTTLAAAWLHSRMPASAARRASRRAGAMVLGALASLAALLALAIAWQPEEALAIAHWPFAWRYDPDLPVGTHTWRRLGLAAGLTAVGLGLLVGALFARRGRLVWLTAAAGLLASPSWPAPRMLLTEATATSYQRSPLLFSDRNLLQGAQLYLRHCAGCHGERADGRGPLAAGLPAWPSVLGPALFDNRLEGELHWRLARDGARHGSGAYGGDARNGEGISNNAPAGGRQSGGRAAGAPPVSGSSETLTADDSWRVLDYLRVHAYGVGGGAGMPAIPAPVVALTCRDGRAATLSGLRGLPLRVVAAAPGAPREPQDPRLLTVALTRGGPPPEDADCVAPDDTAWSAYALAAGLPPQALAGAQFMVDRRGWLRARRLPGAAPAWTSADNVCGPGGRMENTSAQGLGALLLAMDRSPIDIPDTRRGP